MEDKKYFASYVKTADDKVLWYAFGTSEEEVRKGLSGMDDAHVVPCTEEAYIEACKGLWDHLCVTVLGGSESVANINPPVVKALVEGRDL